MLLFYFQVVMGLAHCLDSKLCDITGFACRVKPNAQIVQLYSDRVATW